MGCWIDSALYVFMVDGVWCRWIGSDGFAILNLAGGSQTTARQI